MTKDEMQSRILGALSEQPMRNRELLRVADIEDYRAGEDAIWELMQQDQIRMGADSVLSLVQVQDPVADPRTPAPDPRPSITALLAERSRWPDNWRADIDDPGTKYEEWTGKWYAESPDGEDTEVEVGVPDYSAALARYLERLHNATPALLEVVAAALEWAESDDEDRQAELDVLLVALSRVRR